MKKKTVVRIPGIAVMALVLGVLVPACSSLSLQQVDYAWPVESVLKVKDDNTVTEGRHAMKFNVAPLAEKEFENPNALKGKEIRLLRNNAGMYFITGQNFKHVYIMAPESGELALRTTFEVSQTGLQKPALNQREPYVELIDGSNLRVLMSSDDLLEEQDLRAEGRK